MLKHLLIFSIICLNSMVLRAETPCRKVPSKLRELQLHLLKSQMRQDLTAFFAQNFYIHELDTNYFTASLWKTSIYSPPDLRKKVPIIYIGRVDSKRLGSGLYPDFLNILQSLSKEAGYKGVLIYLVGNRKHHQFYLRNGFSEYPEGSKTKSFLRLNSATTEHSR